MHYDCASLNSSIEKELNKDTDRTDRDSQILNAVKNPFAQNTTPDQGEPLHSM